MLKPNDRRVLLEALRPPSGYTLDRAIAATYSLDLVALLVAPLAFSLFDRLAEQSNPAAGEPDPIGATAILQAVRAHAERLTVFCQAGAIAPPVRYRQLLAYLEGSVVEVRAPAGGVFHPKVWVQRFTAADEPVRYRLIVSSRNLTFDRSWDTILVLDGELKERSNAFARNRPIAALIAALPGLAVHDAPARAVKDAELLSDEIRRVEIEVPEPFEELRFWPLGHDGKPSWPFEAERVDRMLVVSPFVAKETLSKLSARGSGHVLVSRPEDLGILPAEVLAPYAEVHVLNEGAEVEADDAADPDAAASGLHAKLYVADAGRQAHVWTGSANASRAAFHDNVELLVQLTGKKSKVGVDAFLAEGEGGVSLRSLLVPFNRAEAPLPIDTVAKELERRLWRLRIEIACAPWRARVEREGNGEAGAEHYAVRLEAGGAPFEAGPGVRICCWPIALAQDHAAELAFTAAGAAAVFPKCSFQALTSFFAFRVVIDARTGSAKVVFVVNAPLEGAPIDRQARVLLALLDDPAKVMRFLRLLLALDPASGLEDLLGMGEGTDATAVAAQWSRGSETPLLEALLRALDREPQRLGELDRTVRELRSTPEGAALLPADLDRVWVPIREAWETLRTTGGRR